MGKVYRSTDKDLPAKVRAAFAEVLAQKTHDYRFPISVKSFDAGKAMTIDCCANFAAEDRWGEVIVPDAWKKRLSVYKKNPIVLLDHDRRRPIGRCVDVRIEKDGLYATAEIGDPTKAPLTPDQEIARSLIAQGVLRAISVGFIPHVVEWDEDEEVIRYTDVELLEWSVVAIPMQQDSLIEDVKSRKTWRQKMEEQAQTAPTAAEPTLKDVLDAVKATHDHVVKGQADEVAALKAQIADLQAKNTALVADVEKATKAYAELKTKSDGLLAKLKSSGILK